MAVLKWAMIGGGKGSQIGPAHRLGARLDAAFDMVAGALDHNPEAGRAFGAELGLDPARSYGDWREMLEAERNRADRPDLVTIATPNATHYEIAKAYLEAGFHVLCEKPLTVEVAEDLCRELRLFGLFPGPPCAGDGGPGRSGRRPGRRGRIRARSPRRRGPGRQSAHSLAV